LKETKLQFGKVRVFQTKRFQEGLGEVLLPLAVRYQEIPLMVSIILPFMPKTNGSGENQRLGPDTP